MRSPFYDVAKGANLSTEDANDLLDTLALKINLIENRSAITGESLPTKESVAYTRYADRLSDEKSKHIF